MDRYTYKNGKVFRSPDGEYVLFEQVESAALELEEYRTIVPNALKEIDEQSERVDLLIENFNHQNDKANRALNKEVSAHADTKRKLRVAMIAALSFASYWAVDIVLHILT